MYKLTIEGLHKSYGDHEVLKGVSLSAKTGDVISLIVASGSGKSTFYAASTSWNNPTTAP